MLLSGPWTVQCISEETGWVMVLPLIPGVPRELVSWPGPLLGSEFPDERDVNIALQPPQESPQLSAQGPIRDLSSLTQAVGV